MSISLVAPKSGCVKATAFVSPRVIISTDAARVESFPEEVRRAADMFSTEDLDVWRGEPLKADSSGTIVWLEGERLARGSSEEIRSVFFSPAPVETFVPVHLPCLAEADFIGLQPRLIAAGARTMKIAHGIRITGAATPSSAALQAWKACADPWAELHLALLAERKPGEGIEPLKNLWQERTAAPLFASLILRNLIAALLRQQNSEKAEQLLKLGLQAYPDYVDLEYLSAVLWIHRGKSSKAVAPLSEP